VAFAVLSEPMDKKPGRSARSAGRIIPFKWLQTAANIFDLMFKGEGGIRVEPAQAHRSPRPD
jgi:hypothetical protein